MGGRGDQRSKAERWRRYWDKQSRGYDREMGFWDRWLFRDSREWVCTQAAGDVLEVAIGTGLNLAHYPPGLRLTGVDFSPQMLAVARDRAAALGRQVELLDGDAQALALPAASFDTVVCTFGLCAIPDERQAVAEMWRVLRSGGLLLLADHVAAASPAVRVVQRAMEVLSVPLGGEHFLRRPLNTASAAGFRIQRSERFALGVVERLIARKPVDN